MQKISEWFTSTEPKKPETTPEPIDVFGHFSSAYNTVKTQASTVWSFFTSIWDLDNLLNIFDTTKTIVTNIFNSNFFSEIFKKVDTKIGNIFELIFVTDTRVKFASLFQRENWEKTKIVSGMLLNLPGYMNQFLNADSNLFSFLLLQLLNQPTKILDGFQDFSKRVEKRAGYLNGTRGKIISPGSKYSLNPSWLMCAFRSQYWWWMCSNKKTIGNSGLSDSNSLQSFFGSRGWTLES